MKSILNLLQEAEENQEEMEIEVDPQSEAIKNPSFVFQINGTFNFNELERLMRMNEQGLTVDDYELTINTRGKINDEAYESFIVEVEKLKYLEFLR